MGRFNRALAARAAGSRDIISAVVSAMPELPIQGVPVIEPSALICCPTACVRERVGDFPFDLGFVVSGRRSTRCWARLRSNCLLNGGKIMIAVAARRKKRLRRKYNLVTGAIWKNLLRFTTHYIIKNVGPQINH
jgi:hypothetical protein